MEIAGFRGTYRFLSNFYPCTIYVAGLPYPSLEHAYQASKTGDPKAREKIRQCFGPGQAKRAGRDIKLIFNWDDIKEEVMLDLVRQKFKQRDLRDKLLDTYPCQLLETNTWGDRFWGICEGTGENKLGLILMKVRAEIMKEELT